MDGRDPDLHDRLARLEARLEEWMRSVERRLADSVKSSEFWPVKTLFYGMLASALLAVLAKLIAMVLVK